MFKKVVIIFFMVLLVIVSVYAVYSINKSLNSEDEQNNKVNDELDFISKNIIEAGNLLNNIKINEYYVSTNTINSSSEDSNGKSKDNSTSESDDQSSSKEKSSGENKSTLNYYEVTSEEDYEQINWEDVNNKINYINNSWPECVIDLYKINIQGDDILKFSNYLNDLIKYSKQNDKINSINALANMYELIPVFYSQINQTDARKIEVEKTKSLILKAYSQIEIEDWNSMSNNIEEATSQFENLLNDVSNNKNQYNYNKVYVLINEFKNSIDLNDKNIILLKYKNLIKELINIQ